MSYDFTAHLDRRGRDALAAEVCPIPGVRVREGFEPIPMWVADMSFSACPAIPAAIAARAAHPAYGYFNPSSAYTQAILDWYRGRYDAPWLEAAHIGYENGVLGGVASALRTVCSPGDPVLVHTPVYLGFIRCLAENGWRLVPSPLRPDGAGVWRMDLTDMEEKLRRERIHAAILCSPHNPTGRVWAREELEEAMALFARMGVTVVSDEIWADLVLPGARHIPTLCLGEEARRRTVALCAPSKTFNLAGLVGAYHIICEPTLRDRVEREGARTHYNNMNVLSMHALTAAYSPEGKAWLAQLLPVLAENVRFAVEFITSRFPGVEVSPPQGTYMIFLDCARWLAEHGTSLDELLRSGAEAGVFWQDGRDFLGPSHIRMNLALPRTRLEEALQRLEKYVFC